jgi:glycosyltransferase involved in cell wall biosynthesis
MLSILIPTYNYNVYPLVTELKSQCDALNISYEILIQDDCSTNIENINQNSKIEDFSNCAIFYNNINLGRAKNRNVLVKKAKYNWLIFLDCDMFPYDSNFILNYLNAISSQRASFYFGGIIYKKETPNENEYLRWIYGIDREAIPLKIRQKNKYRYTFTSNILVKKSILIQTPFLSNLTKYGFEDLVLILELQKLNIDIQHIENPLYHLNIEKSTIFIDKQNASLENLKLLLDSKIITSKATRISSFKEKVSFFPINLIIITTFKLFKNQIIKNLTSKKPKLFLFDFYRLGYFLNLYHSK